MARNNQDEYAAESQIAGFLRTFLGLGRDDSLDSRVSGSGDGEKRKKGLFWSPYEREGRKRATPPPAQPEYSQPVRPQTTSRFQRPPATNRTSSGSGNGEAEGRVKTASYSQGGAKTGSYSNAPSTPPDRIGSATRVEGSTQPIGYLLESYAKGALPPQGLDEFLQQARTTFTQVGDMYQYWLKFQAESLGRMFTEIRETINPQTDVGNGNRKGPQRVEVVRASTPTSESPPAEYSAPQPESPVETTSPPPPPQERPGQNAPPMDPSNKPWIERE